MTIYRNFIDCFKCLVIRLLFPNHLYESLCVHVGNNFNTDHYTMVD